MQILHSYTRLGMTDTLLHWTTDNDGQTYETTVGLCHAKVWPNMGDGWTASVSHAGSTIGSYPFPTLAAAQTWCAARMADVMSHRYCLWPRERHHAND